MEIKQRANAKINLTLDMTGILPNGYHGLFTVMQSITLGDEVTVRTAGDSGIRLSCSERRIPCDERNTAYKAAQYFFERSDGSDGIEIHIEKKVPSQAGLGGGSSDAAAVLRALNKMFPGRYSQRELYALALRVGADVPFCFAGGTRLCQNVGEIISPLPPLDAFVVIAKPYEGVSTGQAFAKFDSEETHPHPDDQSFLFYAAAGDYHNAVRFAENSFERLISLEKSDRIKEVLYANGAYYAAMSGSGSAFFGLFDDEEASRAAAAELRHVVPFVRYCRTTHK